MRRRASPCCGRSSSATCWAMPAAPGRASAGAASRLAAEVSRHRRHPRQGVVPGDRVRARPGHQGTISPTRWPSASRSAAGPWPMACSAGSTLTGSPSARPWSSRPRKSTRWSRSSTAAWARCWPSSITAVQRSRADCHETHGPSRPRTGAFLMYLRFARYLLWEFRWPLGVFTVLVLGGGLILHRFYRRRRFTVCPGLPRGLPDDLPRVVARLSQTSGIFSRLFFLLPVVGLGAIADSVVRLAFLIFTRKQNLPEWNRMLASLCRNHFVVIGVGKVGYQVIKQLARDARDRRCDRDGQRLTAAGRAVRQGRAGRPGERPVSVGPGAGGRSPSSGRHHHDQRRPDQPRRRDHGPRPEPRRPRS